MYLCSKLSDRVLVKKTIVLLSFILLVSLPGIAQYANSWINFGQQYYKVPVGKDGIYRIGYTTLQAAGFPVGSVDPRLVQLIHRGTEQAIVVQGEGDARFDAGDYIEFYGRKNDGTRDSLLYLPSSLQPHKYYNLYSDTAAYFLTWNLGAVKGKRMVSFFQNNTTGIPKEPAQNHQELAVFTAEYSGGNTTGGGEIQNSYFDEGEGWTDNYISTTNCTGFRDYTISNLTNGVSASGNPSIDVLLVGRDELNHTATIAVGPTTGSLRVIGSSTFINFQAVHIKTDLNWSDIGANGKMIVEVTASCTSGRDKFSLSYINVSLPQSLDVSGQTTKQFILSANPASKSYVEFISPPAGARLWDITDPNNLTVIGTNAASGMLSAVVPATSTPRTLFLSSDILSTAPHAITFQSIDPAAYNYLVVTHASLLSGAQAYADYRSSSDGGNYRPLTLTVDQLYNQFNYGETSPLGIFQFVKFMVENGSPAYLFLIGKSLDVSQGFYRKTSFPSTDLKDLVPTSGLPASDMAFSANLKGSGFAPTVATGRLSASTVAQVLGYLGKIREMETTPLNSLWRKEGLHLSGGILPDELTEFRSYMDGFKTVAEGPYWGGEIATIGKHDPTAVKQINISDEVNAGVNLITFFGHSSPGTIDIDIGKVSDPKLGYNNPGKYPIFLINGCNAGNFFTNGTSFGEDWMLASGKGARGFIAHSFFGYVQNLKLYTDLFYTIGLADSTFIKAGVGDVQKEVATRYLNNYGSYMTNITQVQQMVLLGDPAVKLFGTTKPDYQTDDNSIALAALDGKPVTIASDSFSIQVIVRNFGAVGTVPLQIKLVRNYSDGFAETFLKTVSPVLHQDTIAFTVRKDRTAGSGNNNFTVTLDYPNVIAELNETNNTGSAGFIIPLGGTSNLFPAAYGIVSQPAVDFIFQSVNPLDVHRSFDVQLDTAGTFDSPALVQFTVTGKVLLKTTRTLTGSDSTVYFWRTKLSQPNANESTLWSTSSFTLIRDSPTGWVQRKFAQWQENALDGLSVNASSRKLEFLENTSDVLVATYGWNYPASNLDVSVKINNTEFNIATEGDPCRNNTLNFIAFNKTSLVPYPALDLGFQSIHTCGREPQVINSFTFSEMDNGSGQDVLDYIDNVASGDSVLVFSIGNVNHAGWSSAMRAKMQLLGIDDAALASVGTGAPLVALGRKDAPAGTAKVFVLNDPHSDSLELQVHKTITGRYTSGKMKSALVGPAARWKQALSLAKNIEPSDHYSFSLWGVALDGSETVIQPVLSSPYDLSSIDAAAYPWLRLQLETEDVTALTPVQLSQWLVVYDPMAEGILLFSGPPEQQVLPEGRPWSGAYKFVTISTQAFTDSLAVNFSVLTEGVQKESKSFRIPAPAPGDTTNFTVTTNTFGKAGLNNVDVFVNPRILPEQDYQNNEINLAGYLDVRADHTSPLLDVTVDGRHLQDNDFVSPHPFIRIVITDENSFLLKKDTTGVRIVLTLPCTTVDCPGTPIYFNRPDITWSPATANSGFYVEFTPSGLADGTYSLFVQGADASGNNSGPDPYQITFRVAGETTFSFSTVYPNPSTTAFNFSFLLTGNEVPDQFALNLYSLDGRPIGAFGLSDVREFHVGTNTLLWEPRDPNGNPLPAGMYVYRMMVSVKGEEHREAGKLIFVH